MSSLQLYFEGSLYDDWLEYSCTSDLRRPAASFRLRARPTDSPVTPGGVAELKVDGETVLWGRVDEVTTRRSADAAELELGGRDSGGLLLDCSADPTWTWSRRPLSIIVSQVASYAGVVATATIEYDPTVRKLKAEPGESCWSVLERAVTGAGMRLWVGADGGLVVSPYLTSGPSAGRLTAGDNILESRVRRSFRDAYSEVQVLGEWDDGTATSRLKGTWTDTTAPFFRSMVRTEEVRGSDDAKSQAEVLGTRAAASRFEAVYRVVGHVDGRGKPWAVNTLVDVDDAAEGVQRRLLVVGRRLEYSRGLGRTTELTLAKQELLSV